MITNESEQMNLQSVASIHKEKSYENSIYNERKSQQSQFITIGIQNQKLKALPEEISGFQKYIFLCLFNIFRQWQVIYFIVFCVAKSFLDCIFNPPQMISQISLIIVYLVLQLVLRYKTYRSYVQAETKIKQTVYQIWSYNQKRWISMKYQQLKPGQIVKLNKNIQNEITINPINILPIYLSSKRNHFQLKSTRLNKSQQIKQIPLFSIFKKTIVQQNEMQKDFIKLKNIKILYEYTIKNSEVFQGKVIVDQNESFYISNKLILPKSVPIVDQQYVIGVILINFSNNDKKSLKRNLNLQNKTLIKIGKSLILPSLLLFAVVVTTFFIQFLFIISSHTKRSILSSPAQTYLCLILNIIALVSHYIYVGMFIFLLLHRLRDSYQLKNKNQIMIKNYINSIDQFGQANTIIMDDYFFIDKNLFEVVEILYDTSSNIFFDQQLIFCIIEKSDRLKQQMYDLWMSIIRFFKNKPRRYTKIQNQYKVQLIKEKIFKESLKYCTITIFVQISTGQQNSILSSESLSTKKYIFRFTQNPRQTTIQRIKDEKVKVSVKQLVKNKNLLHLMIQVLETNISSFDLQNENLQLISRKYESTKFQFLGLISSNLKNNPQSYSLSLIKNKQIIKKQNLIILSNKKWKYIEMILEKNSIDTSHIISLEQKQFQNIKYDIKFYLRQLRQFSNFQEKNIILAIHCNLVSYLTRPEIINGLTKIARYSKYIIFYDCSQYQKEVCCMNLFQIFPLHIYLSNYLCDLQLIQKSNLSVCQKGGSTQNYVTLVVQSYKDLRILMLQEAVQSIGITVFIINACLFKNLILIISVILTQFIVYQGAYFVLTQQYTGLMFFLYNLITSLPIVYYILFRPQIWEQPIHKYNDTYQISKLQYITLKKFLVQFIRALLISAFIVIYNFSFILSTVVQNMFFSLLTSCVVACAFYQLFIDDARSKKVQVILSIVIYVVFYIFIYFLSLWNDTGFLLVIIQTNLTTKDTIPFYLSNILIIPLMIGFIFYGMSALNAKIEIQQMIEIQQISQSSSTDEFHGKVSQDYGKQLHFREQ